MKKLLIICIAILLLYSVGAKFISLHETIHQQIFNRYNIDSEIYINYFFLYGYTMPESYEFCNDSCKSQHNLNDIIGYYTALIIYFVFVLIILNKLVGKNEKNNNNFINPVSD